MKATIEFGYHRVIVPFQADQTVSQLMTQELAPRENSRTILLRYERMSRIIQAIVCFVQYKSQKQGC